ncbi:MAG TPA: ATP-binding protein [Polyangiaceae bacterium]|nr:ATP-binding protein [Polyangiaceae bacterium]
MGTRDALRSLPSRRKSSQVAPLGLGLGLYISDQLVRAHGGSIVADSHTSGTRFQATLPRSGGRVGERFDSG